MAVQKNFDDWFERLKADGENPNEIKHFIATTDIIMSIKSDGTLRRIIVEEKDLSGTPSTSTAVGTPIEVINDRQTLSERTDGLIKMLDRLVLAPCLSAAYMTKDALSEICLLRERCEKELAPLTRLPPQNGNNDIDEADTKVNGKPVDDGKEKEDSKEEKQEKNGEREGQEERGEKEAEKGKGKKVEGKAKEEMKNTNQKKKKKHAKTKPRVK
ncbi:hypothetical protein F4802DRAFT_598580 [Xylaria palmicola]|nr:hypothetical protein F4802DRAFT_598580 [Xylaria palmicola]